ncbi:alpha/beta fold hydrolase [Mucilaginibacter terrae]|uniref:Sigma-B regulation protein RsbQ n=1 Tax=Mucilaginibacter terrae TaxID=1955052 RepID=A0ABU3GYR5_9SPHI|nr:alpha/beta hydrolase [Mucilaginibacter terrae]MDT3404571.1 sigma-B regulation protein RsbQ [Mucilaginibacter terrae]
MMDVLKRNNVRVIGKGDQTIVFAHGFGCDQNVWRHFVTAYQEHYQLVLFDFVGAGQSDLTAYNSERYQLMDGYVADLLEVLEALALKQVIFIGHSVSCMIGARAALAKPDYFSNLIFVSPSPCYFNDGDYIGGMEKEDLEALFNMMDSNYLGWSGAMAPLIMGNADRPELGGELTANFCATNPDIAREFARVTFYTDCRTDLHALSVPSLTLQCSEDILAPLSVGYYIKKHTPGNTLVLLDATGHCPHLSAPDKTIEAIDGYLTANKAAILEIPLSPDIII